MNDKAQNTSPETSRRYYPAKILVLGEYSILLGSDAFAIPLRSHFGEWVFPEYGIEQDSDLKFSHQELIRFFQFLSAPPKAEIFGSRLDLKRMEEELRQGISFRSNIPQQSGLGSSGALVAAIYDRYRDPSNSSGMEEVRSTLSKLEAYYHSKSSGIDPLVSFVNRPVMIGKGSPQIMDEPDEGWFKGADLFLIHSGVMGLTKSGVASFWNRVSADQDFNRRMQNSYIPLVNRMVNDMTTTQTRTDGSSWFTLATLQAELFDYLFPPAMKELAAQGLKNGMFALKICGSGGGGFYLAYTSKPEEFREYIEKKGFSLIRVTSN